MVDWSDRYRYVQSGYGGYGQHDEGIGAKIENWAERNIPGVRERAEKAQNYRPGYNQSYNQRPEDYGYRSDSYTRIARPEPSDQAYVRRGSYVSSYGNVDRYGSRGYGVVGRAEQETRDLGQRVENWAERNIPGIRDRPLYGEPGYSSTERTWRTQNKPYSYSERYGRDLTGYTDTPAEYLPHMHRGALWKSADESRYNRDGGSPLGYRSDRYGSSESYGAWSQPSRGSDRNDVGAVEKVEDWAKRNVPGLKGREDYSQRGQGYGESRAQRYSERSTEGYGRDERSQTSGSQRGIGSKLSSLASKATGGAIGGRERYGQRYGEGRSSSVGQGMTGYSEAGTESYGDLRRIGEIRPSGQRDIINLRRQLDRWYDQQTSGLPQRSEGYGSRGMSETYSGPWGSSRGMMEYGEGGMGQYSGQYERVYRNQPWTTSLGAGQFGTETESTDRSDEFVRAPYLESHGEYGHESWTGSHGQFGRGREAEYGRVFGSSQFSTEPSSQSLERDEQGRQTGQRGMGRSESYGLTSSRGSEQYPTSFGYSSAGQTCDPEMTDYGCDMAQSGAIPLFEQDAERMMAREAMLRQRGMARETAQYGTSQRPQQYGQQYGMSGLRSSRETSTYSQAGTGSRLASSQDTSQRFQTEQRGADRSGVYTGQMGSSEQGRSERYSSRGSEGYGYGGLPAAEGGEYVDLEPIYGQYGRHIYGTQMGYGYMGAGGEAEQYGMNEQYGGVGQRGRGDRGGQPEQSTSTRTSEQYGRGRESQGYGRSQQYGMGMRSQQYGRPEQRPGNFTGVQGTCDPEMTDYGCDMAQSGAVPLFEQDVDRMAAREAMLRQRGMGRETAQYGMGWTPQLFGPGDRSQQYELGRSRASQQYATGSQRYGMTQMRFMQPRMSMQYGQRGPEQYAQMGYRPSQMPSQRGMTERSMAEGYGRIAQIWGFAPSRESAQYGRSRASQQYGQPYGAIHPGISPEEGVRWRGNMEPFSREWASQPYGPQRQTSTYGMSQASQQYGREGIASQRFGVARPQGYGSGAQALRASERYGRSERYGAAYRPSSGKENYGAGVMQPAFGSWPVCQTGSNGQPYPCDQFVTERYSQMGRGSETYPLMGRGSEIYPQSRASEQYGTQMPSGEMMGWGITEVDIAMPLYEAEQSQSYARMAANQRAEQYGAGGRPYGQHGRSQHYGAGRESQQYGMGMGETDRASQQYGREIYGASSQGYREMAPYGCDMIQSGAAPLFETSECRISEQYGMGMGTGRAAEQYSRSEQRPKQAQGQFAMMGRPMFSSAQGGLQEQPRYSEAYSRPIEGRLSSERPYGATYSEEQDQYGGPGASYTGVTPTPGAVGQLYGPTEGSFVQRSSEESRMGEPSDEGWRATEQYGGVTMPYGAKPGMQQGERAGEELGQTSCLMANELGPYTPGSSYSEGDKGNLANYRRDQCGM